jgi:hypothetical protein
MDDFHRTVAVSNLEITVRPLVRGIVSIGTSRRTQLPFQSQRRK